MTRDEVMAMTDKRLTVKAAELMGTEKEYLCCEDPCCPPTRCLYGLDDVYDCVHLRDGLDVNACPEMRRGDLPDYPNDIAAAWELVRGAKDLQFQVGNTRHCSDSWWAKFRRGKPQVHAESAAKAITRAFILAMTQEDS